MILPSKIDTPLQRANEAARQRVSDVLKRLDSALTEKKESPQLSDDQAQESAPTKET